MANKWFTVQHLTANVTGYARKCDIGDKFLVVAINHSTREMVSGTYTAEEVRGYGLQTVRETGSIQGTARPVYVADIRQSRIWDMWKKAKGRKVATA